MNSNAPVPVIMYHSIGRVLPDWHWAILTVPAAAFEDQLRWLSASGYKTADLAQLHDHVSGVRPLGPKHVILTFDDGYLDNWTYAVPLLKKYGFTATVCVSPDFVDPGDVVRPTIEDVWNGNAREEEIGVRGFMSWPELQKAHDEGVLSIQSHTMTHTWYPAGPEIVDFHRPGDDHYWLDWNHDPSCKPFYLGKLEESAVPWGTPVYRHEKSLETTRYFPDEAEARHITEYVAKNGGGGFFQKPRWRNELNAELETYRDQNDVGGRMESPGERSERLRYELLGSRKIIEDAIGAKVEHVFWPGGGYSEEALEMGLEVYKSVTWSAKDRWKLKNCPGEDPRKVSRRGAPFIQNRRHRIYTGGRYLSLYLDEYAGSLLARRKKQVLKLWYMAGANLGVWPGNSEEKIPLIRQSRETNPGGK